MIHDSLPFVSLYRSIHPSLALALDYIARFDPATPDGRVVLDGERVFALVQSYVSRPAADLPFESHRDRIDVQFVAAGREIIHGSPLERLTVTKPYAVEKDVQLYSGVDDAPLFMRTGDFAVLFPQDGHKPGCLWQTAGAVKKVVVKIKVWA